jgi:nicotinamidase-related amidase
MTMLMDAELSCLLVIDVQERLLPAMADADQVVRNAAVLLTAANRLGVPAMVSEQYPRGLGTTVAELTGLIPPAAIQQKLHFSCCADTAYRQRFEALGRSQAVVTGIEAHVCVLQTAIDLLAMGVDVFVVADATSSRQSASRETALNRLRDSGAEIVTAEMVIFEWLRVAGTNQFKEFSALVK